MLELSFMSYVTSDALVIIFMRVLRNVPNDFISLIFEKKQLNIFIIYINITYKNKIQVKGQWMEAK